MWMDLQETQGGGGEKAERKKTEAEARAEGGGQKARAEEKIRARRPCVRKGIYSRASDIIAMLEVVPLRAGGGSALEERLVVVDGFVEFVATYNRPRCRSTC